MRKVAVLRYPFLNETFPFKNEQNPSRVDIHPHSTSPPIRQRFNEIMPPRNTNKMISPLSVKSLKSSGRGPSPPPLRNAPIEERMNRAAIDILARQTQEYHYVFEQNCNIDIKGQTIISPNGKDSKSNGAGTVTLPPTHQGKGKHTSDEVNLKTLAKVINHEFFNKTGEKILAVASSVGGGKQKIIKNYNEKMHSPLEDLKNKLNIKKVNKPKFIKIIKGSKSSSRLLIVNSNGGSPKQEEKAGLAGQERESSLPKKTSEVPVEPNFKISPRKNYHVTNADAESESFISEIDDSGNNSRSPHFQSSKFRSGKPHLYVRGQTQDLSEAKNSPETVSSSNARFKFENKNADFTRLSNSSLGNNTESPPLFSRKIQPSPKTGSFQRVGSPSQQESRLQAGNNGEEVNLKPSYLIASFARSENVHPENTHNSSANNILNKTVNLASIRETQSTDENERYPGVQHGSLRLHNKDMEIFEKFNHTFFEKVGSGNIQNEKSLTPDSFDLRTSSNNNNGSGYAAKSKTHSSRWRNYDQSREALKQKENNRKTFDILAQTDNLFSGWDIRESYESEENAKSLYNKINNIIDDEGFDY